MTKPPPLPGPAAPDPRRTGDGLARAVLRRASRYARIFPVYCVMSGVWANAGGALVLHVTARAAPGVLPPVPVWLATTGLLVLVAAAAYPGADGRSQEKELPGCPPGEPGSPPEGFPGTSGSPPSPAAGPPPTPPPPPGPGPGRRPPA